MACRISSLCWLTGSSGGYEIGGMAARRAARSPALACEREERSVRPARDDITERDSIPAGRIDQVGPHRITDFRPGSGPPAARPWPASAKNAPSGRRVTTSQNATPYRREE